MTPELIGIIALGVALFGSLKWLSDRMDKQFERIDKRFDRVDKRFDRMDDRLDRMDADISSVKEGQARLEGMFEGAFERIPRARPENGGEEGGAVTASSRRRVEQ